MKTTSFRIKPKHWIFALSLPLSLTIISISIAQQNAGPAVEILDEKPSLVDYEGFQKLTNDVQAYRTTRLVDLETFVAYANEPGVLVLDTRSKEKYKEKHIAGAIHLNFSDFTADKLASLIPDKDTKILIYCNNNILDDPLAFASKSMPLALNIPTFINLYGYGYKNIYELSSLVSVTHPALKFEGTMMKK